MVVLAALDKRHTVAKQSLLIESIYIKLLKNALSYKMGDGYRLSRAR